MGSSVSLAGPYIYHRFNGHHSLEGGTSQKKSSNGTNSAMTQLLPPVATTNRLQRAIRDRKAEEEVLIHISLPCRTHAYVSPSTRTPGYIRSAEHKVTSVCTTKKVTASMHQTDEDVGPVKGTEWWNKEFSACVVK